MILNAAKTSRNALFESEVARSSLLSAGQWFLSTVSRASYLLETYVIKSGAPGRMDRDSLHDLLLAN